MQCSGAQSLTQQQHRKVKTTTTDKQQIRYEAEERHAYIEHTKKKEQQKQAETQDKEHQNNRMYKLKKDQETKKMISV